MKSQRKGPNQIGWCNHFDLKKKQVQDFKFKEGFAPHRFAFDITSHVQSWMFGVNLSCRPCGHCHKALISLITEERTGPEGRKSSKKYADAKAATVNAFCILCHVCTEHKKEPHLNTKTPWTCRFVSFSSHQADEECSCSGEIRCPAFSTCPDATRCEFYWPAHPLCSDVNLCQPTLVSDVLWQATDFLFSSSGCQRAKLIALNHPFQNHPFHIHSSISIPCHPFRCLPLPFIASVNSNHIPIMA